MRIYNFTDFCYNTSLFNYETYYLVETAINCIEKLQKDNYELDRESQHYFDRMQDLKRENEQLKEEVKLHSIMNLEEYSKHNTISVLGKEYISTDIIRNILEYNGGLSEFEVYKILNKVRGDNND